MTRRERRELARAQTPRVRSRVAATKRPAWQSPLVLVSSAAFVVIVVVILLIQKPGGSGTGDPVPPPPNAAVAAGLADGETLGRADAPLTVEVWSDFQCPVCGSFVRDYLPRLITEFIVPGQVRLLPHDIAILGATADNESLAAAVGARCAGIQGKYWDYHDWLFYNQSGENLGAFSADRLARIADDVGLDRAAWNACVDDQSQVSVITANTNQARAQGITSTPTFWFGGQTISGLPRAYADLASQIRAVLPSGTPTTPAGSPGNVAPSGSAGAAPS